MASAARSIRGRRPRGWFATAAFGTALALTLFSRPPVSEDSQADLVLDVAAWAFFLAGGALRLWATLYIAGRKGKSLITEGPFSLCRNPLYVGSMLIAISLALFLKSPVVLAAALVAGVTFAVYVVPDEERRLHEHFGQAFLDYRERTARFLPSLRNYYTSPTIEVNLSGLGRELSRALWWGAIPLIATLVTHARLQPGWPHLNVFL